MTSSEQRPARPADNRPREEVGDVISSDRVVRQGDVTEALSSTAVSDTLPRTDPAEPPAQVQFPIVSPAVGWTALVVGAILTVAGYIVWGGVFLTPMLGGVVLIVVGLIMLALPRRPHAVRVTDEDGTSTVVTVGDEDSAHRMANQINEAAGNPQLSEHEPGEHQERLRDREVGGRDRDREVGR